MGISTFLIKIDHDESVESDADGALKRVLRSLGLRYGSDWKQVARLDFLVVFKDEDDYEYVNDRFCNAGHWMKI